MLNRRKTICLMASTIPLAAWASEISTTQDPLDIVSLQTAASWEIVNDGVMGGLSRSNFRIADNSIGVFSGELSLENNGGFASVRTPVIVERLSRYSGLKIRVKGDGRAYQLRLRSDWRFDGIAYKSTFQTQDGVWETFVIDFDEFKPTWRGRILDNVGPVKPDDIHRVGFLVTGHEPGPFALEVLSVQAISIPRTGQ